MSLDPQGMLLLAALAENGGIRRAAAKLGIPRSTVSRRLAQLEEDAGVRLVMRTARRFALTDVGDALAARAKELAALLDDSADIVRRAKAEPSGTLRIAAAPVLGEDVLPEIVAALAHRYPRLTVDARLSPEYVDIRRGDADVALRASVVEDASDVYAVRLGTSITGCFASPSYLASHGTPQSPGELGSHACILVAGRTKWRLRDELVGGRMRVDNFRLARSLAVGGAGIVWIAKSFAKPLVERGELVPVLPAHWSRTPIFAVHASGSPPPAKIRAFIDLAKTAVARVLLE
jgi:DNA-binding transcriptional LysR family regulator